MPSFIDVIFALDQGGQTHLGPLVRSKSQCSLQARSGPEYGAKTTTTAFEVVVAIMVAIATMAVEGQVATDQTGNCCFRGGTNGSRLCPLGIPEPWILWQAKHTTGHAPSFQ